MCSERDVKKTLQSQRTQKCNIVSCPEAPLFAFLECLDFFHIITFNATQMIFQDLHILLENWKTAARHFTSTQSILYISCFFRA